MAGKGHDYATKLCQFCRSTDDDGTFLSGLKEIDLEEIYNEYKEFASQDKVCAVHIVYHACVLLKRFEEAFAFSMLLNRIVGEELAI